MDINKMLAELRLEREQIAFALAASGRDLSSRTTLRVRVPRQFATPEGIEPPRVRRFRHRPLCINCCCPIAEIVITSLQNEIWQPMGRRFSDRAPS